MTESSGGAERRLSSPSSPGSKGHLNCPPRLGRTKALPLDPRYAEGHLNCSATPCRTKALPLVHRYLGSCSLRLDSVRTGCLVKILLSELKFGHRRPKGPWIATTLRYPAPNSGLGSEGGCRGSRPNSQISEYACRRIKGQGMLRAILAQV